MDPATLRRHLLCIILALAATTISRIVPTWAQSSADDSAIATKLFNDAQKLLDSGKVAQACPKLAESHRLNPLLGTLLSLSECYDQLGKTASAWTALNHAIEMAAEKKDRREAEARQVLAELEKRLPRLKITVHPSPPADLVVRKNGDVLGQPAWDSELPIDPGSYTISASANGYQEWSTVVEVPPQGVSLQVMIPALTALVKPTTTAPLVSPPPPQTVPPPVTPQPVSPPPASHGLRTAGYITAAAGGAALVTGVVFGLLTRAKISERDDANACSATRSCTPDDKTRIEDLGSRAQSFATMANVAFIAGGVAAAAGVVMILVAPNHGGRDRQMAVSPIILREGGGLAWAGRW